MPTDIEVDLIKSAPQFDVHRWSDFPEINLAVHDIFEEVLALRRGKGTRIREPKKIRTHLKVCILDLWAATRLSLNPYRSISRNKADYQNESRYRKIFLTYAYLIHAVDDLLELGYVEQSPGFRYRTGAMVGRRSRIKATAKLVDMIEAPDYGVGNVVAANGMLDVLARLKFDPDDAARSIESETIILRDSDGNVIDYEETAHISQMRSNLSKINSKLAATRIALRIDDEQFAALNARINSERYRDRRTIDFTNNQLHRVFNNASFEDGGRFYGGWWQEIPREFRKHIEINRRDTVELDYSGHHIRILYADKNEIPPDDPYDLSETEFPREDQKRAILVILNAGNRYSAIKAMAKSGIKNASGLAAAMEDRHGAIKDQFYSGVGIKLQRRDSDVAEIVMLEMLHRGATVLPLHDSFLVRSSYEDELKEFMQLVFADFFGKEAKIKPKVSVREEWDKQKKLSNDADPFVTDDLDELFKAADTSKRTREIFGP